MENTFTSRNYTSSYPHPAPNHNLRKALSPRRASRTLTLAVPPLPQTGDIVDSRLTVATDHMCGTFDIPSGLDGKGEDLFGEKDDTLSPSTAVASEGDDHEQVFSITKS